MLLVLMLLVLAVLVLVLLVLVLLVLVLLVFVLLVLVLLVLVLLLLMDSVKKRFLVKSSGASPVFLMNDVRNTVFDRLPISLCNACFSIYFLAH